MVLFRDDLLRQNVFVDELTSNISFLKMAIQLNRMGVKNNKFFLSIYDRDLIGKDPHNLNDPSVELRQRIGYECKINFWYFIRTVIRVISAGTDGIPYILNRANLAQAWLFFNNVTSFLTMPRQIGKTIGMLCIALWYLYIAGKKLSWGMFCQGSMLQWDNVKRLKELRDALPKYLWHPSVADSNNKEGLSYSDLDTHLQTFIAQMDKQAADRLGRGSSLSAESWDELAYFVNNNLSWSSAKAAMNTAAPNARKAGLPASVIITTTAGDIDDKWGKFAYQMVMDAMRFSEKFYDLENHEKFADILHHNSRNDIVYLEYSHTQLGKDQAWFDEVTRSLDPKVIAKDYLNQWQHGSDDSIFDKDILDRLAKSKRDPVQTTWIESMVTRWYVDPDKLKSDAQLRNKPYALGCDTSDCVGKDFTTLVMTDPYDLSVVATLRCNVSNLVFVARAVAKFLTDFPRAVFIPERNKNGAFLIDYIILELQKNGINPLKRIYNKYFQEYDKDIDLEKLNYASGTIRKNFGFNTTSSATSRSMLYSRVMVTALKLGVDRIYDPNLVDELCGLTVRNNRVDHSEMGHDDTVISYLLSCYFLLFAQNHRFYNIDTDEILCNVRDDGGASSMDEKKRIQQVRLQIIDYKKKLKSCNNDIMRQVYMRELQYLQAQVGDTGEDEIKETDVASMSQVVKESASASKNNPAGLNAADWLSMC